MFANRFVVGYGLGLPWMFASHFIVGYGLALELWLCFPFLTTGLLLVLLNQLLYHVSDFVPDVVLVVQHLCLVQIELSIG